MTRQSDFHRLYPDVHSGTWEKYPDFDYHRPAGDASVWHDMRNPLNQVGHQQRAFNVWWALETCGPCDLGLDLGSPKGLTPYCIHVDVFGNGGEHPFYHGGPYQSDIAWDATRIAEIVPPNSIPHVCSNHSLEHMPAAGDPGIVRVLATWMKLLRKDGILALIVPDNDAFDVLASDKDHKHAWGARDFHRRILDPLLVQGGTELVEYDTLRNHFSFNAVLKKTA
jgi:hypothetical protein